MTKYQRKTSKKAYSGVLLKPIPADIKMFEIIHGDKAEEELKRFVDDARHYRLEALAKHFGLHVDTRTEEGKTAVLWALAAEHVAGFKIDNGGEYRQGRGRPSQWKGVSAFMMRSTIYATAKAKNISERKACGEYLKVLQKEDPSTYQDMKLETFYARYKEMKGMDEWTGGGKESLDTYLEQVAIQHVVK
ncbi:MAG: hypothetical protein H6922_01730 [Pseudomonadaceae bacterium]|nr:hypothetical protein [Pseudomonadaceae bacterium]